jgi:hypothetical protein
MIFLCLLVHVKEVGKQFIMIDYVMENELKNIYFLIFFMFIKRMRTKFDKYKDWKKMKLKNYLIL